MRWIVLQVLSFFLFTHSLSAEVCRWPEVSSKIDLATAKSGQLVSFRFLNTIPQSQLTKTLPKSLAPQNNVHLYRLLYTGMNLKNELKVMSALVAIPDVCQDQLPSILLLHGTIISDLDAPTNRANEGLAEASQGFVTWVPDQYGYGATADELHPYLIEKNYVEDGVALLMAARDLSQRLQKTVFERFFLKGYSAGGYAALAIQKALEQDYSDEFPITASAPSAGPYNLLVTGYNLLRFPRTNPVSLTFIIVSYFEYLPQNLQLSDILQNPDEWNVRQLFRGQESYDSVLEKLPNEVDQLIVPAYRQGFLQRVEDMIHDKNSDWNQFEQQLLVNSLDQGWLPQTPTRFFHCVDDEIVPIQSSDRALEKLSSQDNMVSYERIPSPENGPIYRHSNCPGYYMPINWFQTFLD
ncbi:MAG: alpha/beta hydrolase family protein [Oligoflexus sp.]